MIDGCDRRESDHRMTILANIGCRNMRSGLADRVDVVMAVDTVAGNIVVVEIRRRERNRRVAVFAGISARDVAGCLTRCRRAVMAAHTRADHLCMVNAERRRKRDDAVTILAARGRSHVIDRLTYGVDRVMAAYAVACDVVVIEIRR